MRYKIKDESGDKEFFTIIPNFIINHSTAIDKALYLEMKRFAGEDGKCFATEKTIMERLKIGKKAFDNSLNYLLQQKWLSFIGLTNSKTRPIKTYKINNIWQQNSDYYKKISAESNISLKDKSPKLKDKSPKLKDKSPKQHKISSESNVEEDIYKEDIEEDIAETAEHFSFKDKLKEMKLNTKNPLIPIIAFYWEYKQLTPPENEEQYQKKLTRELRGAKPLVDYPLERIKEVMKWLNSSEFLTEVWTIETIFKFIDRDLIKITDK